MSSYMPYDRLNAAIERLTNELHAARHTIIDLMPANFADLLRSYYGCESSKETIRWLDEVAEAIIELAKPEPNPAPTYVGDSAYCPLCRGGSSSVGARGFMLPEGLRRHLAGSGNVQQCSVMNAAKDLARDYWHSKFAAADAKEREQQAANLAERKARENLFLLGPKETPLLMDEHLGYPGHHRDDAGLQWAEARIRELGLSLTIDDRIRTYSCDAPDYCIYADPRAKGEICFRVYPIPLPRRRLLACYAQFSIKDAWKHDLSSKFAKRLEEARGQLVARSKKAGK